MRRIAVITAGFLALMVAVSVPAAVVAEDVATPEQRPAVAGASLTPPSTAAPILSPAPLPASTADPILPDAADPSSLSKSAATAAAADPEVVSIRLKLADPGIRKVTAPDDIAALEAFYAVHNGPALWMTPMGFSAKGQAVIDEISKADDWGLSAAAFDLPSAGALPKTAEVQAKGEIDLDLAILKYA